jgi:hypothetical protein
MAKQPLGEVFGFPVNNMSAAADLHRQNRLCPFNNRVPSCTKDKANDPLGVCSVIDDGEIAITCPIRLKQDWTIAIDAAQFFFPKSKWTTLAEVRLNDRHGKSAGNIDVVVVAYDEVGKITDFGALEIQAVYISGNVRNPFRQYMKDPHAYKAMDWSKEPNQPRPDYLSSSRKRLAPQLIYKGGILQTWKKKIAVALHRGFFETLPTLKEVPKANAEVAWMVYNLALDSRQKQYRLKHWKTVYTNFDESLNQITRSDAGDLKDFVGYLQEKVDEKLENPPDAKALEIDEIG